MNNIGQVEYAVEQIDFSTYSDPLDEEAVTWQSASLDQSSTAASEWSFTIPDTGLEQYYQIHLRSEDAGGNRETASTIWSGLIDQVPPTVTASGEVGVVSGTTVTTYTFTFSDFLLDETSFVQPCDAGDLVSLTYDDATLPYDGLPYQVSATCRITGTESSRTFTACDGAGHCTNETLTFAAPTLTASIVSDSVQLDWSEAVANCTYTVYRSSAPYSGFAAWQTGLTVLTTSDPDGLNDSYFYYVAGEGCDGDENTAVSNTAATFPFALTPGD